MTDSCEQCHRSVPVSICLTTYNRAAVLSRTIESILGQTFSDFELIISDDCSTDHTEELCRDYARRDSRVRYLRNPSNLQMPGNLNSALCHARGRYIANLHDGDVYRPDLIGKWKAALDAQPKAPFVFNAYRWCRPGCAPEVVRQFDSTSIDGLVIARQFFETLTCCVWGTVMARASAYTAAGGFNPSFGFLSDVDMWLRLALGAAVAYVPEPLIDLTPRELTHPYAFFHWRSMYWQYAIYVCNWPLYEPLLGPIYTRSRYKKERRMRFLRGMASSLKHRKWDRVREGFAIWRESDDWFLRCLGTLLGSKNTLPDWYAPDYWTNLRFPALSERNIARVPTDPFARSPLES